jgi:L-gulonolactone oxidase
VTGGSGGIGQTLLKYLLESFHVKALFRRKNATTQQWHKQGCEIVLGDLREEESLINLVAGTEFVFHCAALTASFSRQEAHEVNVEGTCRLALAAAQSDCKRFIHVSSVAVYMGADLHRQDRQVYTEELELQEVPEMELYCLTKLRAETALKQVAQNHKLEYVILRPTCVYGPGVPSYTMGPFDSIQKGRPVILGDGTGLMDVVYVDDVATAMLLAADSPEANGEIFNVGGETISFKEFYTYYEKMLNRPVRHLPKIIAKGGARLAKIHREFGKSFNWYVELQEKSDEYPSTKAKKLLGYTPQFPLTVAMLKTELWLGANGYIPEKSRVFKNADLLYSFFPCAVVHPTTEAEIVQVIQEAGQQGLKVRAIGAIHSLAPIPATEGVCIVLDKYKQVVNIEDSLVTVQAGIKIWELNEILAQHNLALPILGTIDRQTVSGGISTGTHGGSLFHQSLSSYVQALRLVRADGSILEVDCSQKIFNAVGLSMGLLGIISTVTFKCVPAFSLQSKLCKIPIDILLQNFDDIQTNNKYVDIRYTPITDTAQVILINPSSENLKENSGWHPVVKNRIKQRMTNFINEIGLHLFYSYQLNWLQRWSIKQHDKAPAYACVSGRSDFVLIHFDAMTNDLDERVLGPSGSDMEIGIPYSQARAALTCLRNHFHKTQKYPSTHIHIRCAAADDFWLSPAYKQPICWLEFWEYPRTGEYFREIVELLKPFNFRCHWAKDMPIEQEYLRKQYEKWNDFIRLRQEWDSKGMFANSCLDRHLRP